MPYNQNVFTRIGEETKETSKPTLLPIPDIAKVSLGSNFSAIITTAGKGGKFCKVYVLSLRAHMTAVFVVLGDLYTFGFGGSRLSGMGFLGQGNLQSYPTPTLVQSLIEDGCYAADVHCGEYSVAYYFYTI